MEYNFDNFDDRILFLMDLVGDPKSKNFQRITVPVGGTEKEIDLLSSSLTSPFQKKRIIAFLDDKIKEYASDPKLLKAYKALRKEADTSLSTHDLMVKFRTPELLNWPELWKHAPQFGKKSSGMKLSGMTFVRYVNYGLMLAEAREPAFLAPIMDNWALAVSTPSNLDAETELKRVKPFVEMVDIGISRRVFGDEFVDGSEKKVWNWRFDPKDQELIPCILKRIELSEHGVGGLQSLTGRLLHLYGTNLAPSEFVETKQLREHNLPVLTDLTLKAFMALREVADKHNEPNLCASVLGHYLHSVRERSLTVDSSFLDGWLAALANLDKTNKSARLSDSEKIELIRRIGEECDRIIKDGKHLMPNEIKNLTEVLNSRLKSVEQLGLSSAIKTPLADARRILAINAFKDLNYKEVEALGLAPYEHHLDIIEAGYYAKVKPYLSYKDLVQKDSKGRVGARLIAIAKREHDNKNHKREGVTSEESYYLARCRSESDHWYICKSAGPLDRYQTRSIEHLFKLDDFMGLVELSVPVAFQLDQDTLGQSPMIKLTKDAQVVLGAKPRNFKEQGQTFRETDIATINGVKVDAYAQLGKTAINRIANEVLSDQVPDWGV